MRKDTEKKRHRVTDIDRIFADMKASEEVEWFCPDWERLNISPFSIREDHRNARMKLK